MGVESGANWGATHALGLRLSQERAVCVQVARHEGSVPRERGAWMVVFADELWGTIGGGRLEFDAVTKARDMLLRPSSPSQTHRFALGPSLGQCCGGVVWLAFERFEPTDSSDVQDIYATKNIAVNPLNTLANFENMPKTLAQRRVDRLLALEATLAPVALFGGGHVGRAIVQALTPLPMNVSWIDSRDEIFPGQLGHRVRTEHSDPVQAAVTDTQVVPAGSRVLIMSFSHAEDLEIVAACLSRQRNHQNLSFVGLIGSATKWASFQSRLRQRGYTETELAGVSCPIGLPGIRGKEPEVIAASVAAQLLAL